MNLALDCKEFGKYLVFLTGFKKMTVGHVTFLDLIIIMALL